MDLDGFAVADCKKYPEGRPGVLDARACLWLY